MTPKIKEIFILYPFKNEIELEAVRKIEVVKTEPTCEPNGVHAKGVGVSGVLVRLLGVEGVGGGQVEGGGGGGREIVGDLEVGAEDVEAL